MQVDTLLALCPGNHQGEHKGPEDWSLSWSAVNTRVFFVALITFAILKDHSDITHTTNVLSECMPSHFVNDMGEKALLKNG